ncbi:MAG: NAD(P)H-hydrate dehydratase, partial [Desulfurococcales archaeon]|nr:NAD(P)H-hydrate dehydratase [Desulfurococcales archaeon]
DMGYARLIEPRDSRWGDPWSADVVVDGLLGIGVRGGLREPILTLARAFSEHQGLRVSIDTPTGVDPDTGNIAPGAVVADVTVTLHKAKRGLLAERARLHTGELLVADIGLPGKAEEVAGPGDYVARIPPRPRDAHKGVGGKVLIVGGSERYIGAPMLAALAAARAGADLVYLASPSRAAEEAAARSSTVLPIRLGGGHLSRGHVDEVLRAAERVHSIVVGPGLGDYGEALEAASILIERLKSKPIVVDADGLKALDPGICREGCGALVITPHRGEAARLLGSPGEPRAMAEELARTYRATVLLKGPTDYICGPSRCRVNRSGTPNMSVGGTGDVLSGVIAAFLARRTSLGRSLDPLNTAAAAAYITGRTGELAVEAVGENISALDVIEKINNAIQEARGMAAGHGQR